MAQETEIRIDLGMERVVFTEEDGRRLVMGPGKCEHLLQNWRDNNESRIAPILPPMTRCLYQVTENMMAAVIEIPHGVYELFWSNYGNGISGKSVRLALPYVVMIVPFFKASGRLFIVEGQIKAFFRNERLASLDDELYRAALPNVMPETDNMYNARNYICLGHDFYTLFQTLVSRPERFIAASIKEVIQRFFTYSFGESMNWNYSVHELSPNEQKAIYPLATWMDKTITEPGFILRVPWTPLIKDNRLIDQLRNAGFYISSYDQGTYSKLIQHQASGLSNKSFSLELLDMARFVFNSI